MEVSYSDQKIELIAVVGDELTYWNKETGISYKALAAVLSSQTGNKITASTLNNIANTRRVMDDNESTGYIYRKRGPSKKVLEALLLMKALKPVHDTIQTLVRWDEYVLESEIGEDDSDIDDNLLEEYRQYETGMGFGDFGIAEEDTGNPPSL